MARAGGGSSAERGAREGTSAGTLDRVGTPRRPGPAGRRRRPRRPPRRGMRRAPGAGWSASRLVGALRGRPGRSRTRARAAATPADTCHASAGCHAPSGDRLRHGEGAGVAGASRTGRPTTSRAAHCSPTPTPEGSRGHFVYIGSFHGDFIIRRLTPWQGVAAPAITTPTTLAVPAPPRHIPGQRCKRGGGRGSNTESPLLGAGDSNEYVSIEGRKGVSAGQQGWGGQRAHPFQ